MKCEFCDDPAPYVDINSKKPFCRECTFRHSIAAYICERCECQILEMTDTFEDGASGKCYCQNCYLALCEQEVKA